MRKEIAGVEKKRVAIYCRVSTKGQVEDGNSLSSQERICKEYALKKDYEIAELFLEKGESAKTADRTELQRLLHYCALSKNRISVVVFYKIDRWARQNYDYGHLKIILKKYGVKVESATEHIEDTPSGRLMENMISSIGQFDNEVRAERCSEGMKDAMREGRYVWMAPVGYDNIRKINGKATIAPNDTAPLIRKVFERVAQNVVPVEEVYRWAMKQGLNSRNGKPVVKSYFYMMLRNEVYAGWIVKFGERHKGLYEPIITDELFEQVQQVVKHRTRRNFKYQTEHPDFPLRRFVSHSTGTKLTGCWAKGRSTLYPYYRFLHIRFANFRKEAFENEFKSFLNNFSLNERHYDKLYKLIKKHLIGEQETEQKESKQLEQHISDLKQKQKMLIQKNLDGVITDSILREQLGYIESELLKANAAITGLSQEFVGIEAMLDFIADFLKNPGNTWALAEPNEKIQLQWFDFPKGITFDGEKFRTAEICSLFKVKESFLTSNSYGVNLKVHKYNSTPSAIKSLTLNGDSDESKIYWRQIGHEVIRLNEILKNITHYPQKNKI